MIEISNIGKTTNTLFTLKLNTRASPHGGDVMNKCNLRWFFNRKRFPLESLGSRMNSGESNGKKITRIF